MITTRMRTIAHWGILVAGGLSIGLSAHSLVMNEDDYVRLSDRRGRVIMLGATPEGMLIQFLEGENQTARCSIGLFDEVTGASTPGVKLYDRNGMAVVGITLSPAQGGEIASIEILDKGLPRMRISGLVGEAGKGWNSGLLVLGEETENEQPSARRSFRATRYGAEGPESTRVDVGVSSGSR